MNREQGTGNDFQQKLSCTFTTHDEFEYEYCWIIIMIQSHSDHFLR